MDHDIKREHALLLLIQTPPEYQFVKGVKITPTADTKPIGSPSH